MRGDELVRKLLVLLLAGVILVVCGCDSGKDATKKVFDFTKTELLAYFNEEFGIVLQPIDVVTDSDGWENFASYIFQTQNDTLETMMHYHISYDKDTEKVSVVSFFFSQNFMGDITSARTRLYYHLDAIARLINPNANMEELYGAIEKGNPVYTTDDFTVIYSDSSEKFTVTFFVPDANKQH